MPKGTLRPDTHRLDNCRFQFIIPSWYVLSQRIGAFVKRVWLLMFVSHRTMSIYHILYFVSILSYFSTKWCNVTDVNCNMIGNTDLMFVKYYHWNAICQFAKKTPSYWYRNSYCKSDTVVTPSYHCIPKTVMRFIMGISMPIRRHLSQWIDALCQTRVSITIL